jgi:replicative DNA helicase
MSPAWPVTDFHDVPGYEQLNALHGRATDRRPVITTGFPGLDSLFHRGGLQAGTLVVLGGRQHTRKTTVMLNWILNLLFEGVPTALISLDEPLAMYVSKLLSAMTRLPSEWLENEWETPKVEEYRAQYKGATTNLAMTVGSRPTMQQLTQVLENETEHERPRVVFIDYLTLLGRDKYAGQDANRIPRLMEELQVWTSEQAVVTVALHQVGRMDDGHAGRRYHGSTPLTAESLRYGGEEQADIVLGTFRPALDHLGNHSLAMAKVVYGKDFDEEEWSNAVERVRDTKNSTFIQLLKNRPGVKLAQEGIELVSPDESQFLHERKVDG